MWHFISPFTLCCSNHLTVNSVNMQFNLFSHRLRQYNDTLDVPGYLEKYALPSFERDRQELVGDRQAGSRDVSLGQHQWRLCCAHSRGGRPVDTGRVCLLPNCQTTHVQAHDLPLAWLVCHLSLFVCVRAHVCAYVWVCLHMCLLVCACACM